MTELYLLREQVERDQERIARLEQQLYDLRVNNPNAIIDRNLL